MFSDRPRAMRLNVAVMLALFASFGGCGPLDGQQVTSSQVTGSQAQSSQDAAEAPSPADTGNAAGPAVLGSKTLGPGANAQLLALKAPIEAAAATTGVSANVIAGTIWAEARGIITQPQANLMQIGQTEFDQEKAAHQEIKGDITDTASNIMSGAFYLRLMQTHMKQRFGRDDLGITMRAYNSGENSTDPTDLSATPAGTGVSDYVANVVSFVTIIAGGAGELPP